MPSGHRYPQLGGYPQKPPAGGMGAQRTAHPHAQPTDQKAVNS